MQQLALVQQVDDVAALRFVQVRGRPQHADALPDQAAHHGPQLAPRYGIDADAGLVEQQQSRLADQRAGKAELLLHAAGELAGEAPLEGPEVREPHQHREALRTLAAGSPRRRAYKFRFSSTLRSSYRPKRCGM